MKSEHRVAIVAAMNRVYVYDALDGAQFARELAWALATLSITARGRIMWRAFPLGQLLFEVLGESQNWRCCYCGVRTNEHDHLYDEYVPTFEHVIPLGRKGPDHPDNLAIACYACNQGHAHRYTQSRVKYYVRSTKEEGSVSRENEFNIPKGMALDIVAQTFAAYLQGAEALTNSLTPEGTYRYGPYLKQDSTTDWQLDDTNNFFLHGLEDGRAWINCRYPGQQPIAAAMIVLFNLRFNPTKD